MAFYSVYGKIKSYMAQYKVPQDVEAEDKLLGPFTFRQFVYLLIAAAGIAGAWGLFQIFPLLGLIPLPGVILFGTLALPLRKDQPMETYLAAVVSFYLKPNRRLWSAGQRESTILITAPKKVEKPRTRDITEDEASHRLSFLANLVDSEGYAIRGESAMKDEYAAEASAMEDILETSNPVIDRMISEEQYNRHQEVLSQMQSAINTMENVSQPVSEPQPMQQNVTQQMTNLANNNTFSVQTIANQANRIQQQQSVYQPIPHEQPQPQNQNLYGPPAAIFSPKEEG